MIRLFEARDEERFFWATHAHTELDLLLFKHNHRLGFEFNYTDNPKVTKSMRIALADVKLKHLGIIYPGDQIYRLSDTIKVYGIQTFASGAFMTELKKEF